VTEKVKGGEWRTETTQISETPCVRSRYTTNQQSAASSYDLLDEVGGAALARLDRVHVLPVRGETVEV